MGDMVTVAGRRRQSPGDGKTATDTLIVMVNVCSKSVPRSGRHATFKSTPSDRSHAQSKFSPRTWPGPTLFGNRNP
jgi:hypothetical protein